MWYAICESNCWKRGEKNGSIGHLILSDGGFFCFVFLIYQHRIEKYSAIVAIVMTNSFAAQIHTSLMLIWTQFIFSLTLTFHFFSILLLLLQCVEHYVALVEQKQNDIVKTMSNGMGEWKRKEKNNFRNRQQVYSASIVKYGKIRVCNKKNKRRCFTLQCSFAQQPRRNEKKKSWSVLFSCCSKCDG